MKGANTRVNLRSIMAGVISKLSKIEIKTSGTTYVALGGLIDWSGLGGGSSPDIDVTDLSSTGKEFLTGLKDEGTVTVNCNFLPTDAGQLAVETARNGGNITSFKATYGSGTGAPIYAFDGFVKTFELGVGVDKQISLSFSIKLTGSTTKTLTV
jgi:hypothetical protein